MTDDKIIDLTSKRDKEVDTAHTVLTGMLKENIVPALMDFAREHRMDHAGILMAVLEALAHDTYERLPRDEARAVLNLAVERTWLDDGIVPNEVEEE